MFLVIIQPYDLVLETGVRLVEVRQADEYWCAVATGTDVHQTNGSASSVAVAVANVHHVRIDQRASGAIEDCVVSTFPVIKERAWKLNQSCFVKI